MKLIYCPECEDIVKLTPGYWRYCNCRASAGRYSLDGIVDANNFVATKAEITGLAVCFGIPNEQFVMALHTRATFTAWFYGDVIPHHGNVKVRKINKDRIAKENREAFEYIRNLHIKAKKEEEENK